MPARLTHGPVPGRRNSSTNSTDPQYRQALSARDRQNETVSSRNESELTGRRLRPATWAILAWMIIMITAILGAWKGSEARFGVLSEITVATDRSTFKALLFTATDLDDNSFTNPVPESSWCA
ncbi:hypothetical protein C8N39_1093 [Dietzia psychralcaliphila]|nr:hypothetical protein C8N39_1093 [Dietzia psychralcaliphila]